MLVCEFIADIIKIKEDEIWQKKKHLLSIQ